MRTLMGSNHVDSEGVFWAFVSECLSVGGFSIKRRRSHCHWEWLLKDGVLEPDLIWVGCALIEGGELRVGRVNHRGVDMATRIFGTVNVADPEFCPKLLKLVDYSVRQIIEEPHLSFPNMTKSELDGRVRRLKKQLEPSGGGSNGRS